mmetsp:Transcript_1916/g.2472  ORF Transcript_1916/g.2472 Transcript_1916/m.2472 type:complete len:391 (-) Transcript_1916:703-1875(-)|eukprot:CAMPEP_0204846214 /NCGR_PEP_ID=MMETSP1347-20130617/1814_1 /ASSEMBLY_ACC=CAM_ASM_000690 /TAXON_ID=215587 /ORGANISM="Aplanochytrium stocchinoi, Strain GSBS06" /LENGTH=390 /DNA_ID=CAMNT_0051986679 /DNA_START=190 /DNA_END=1362 /DNA_ORIENTATION=+
MAPKVPNFGKKSKEKHTLESQLKAKDLELQEFSKRITELEEINAELRMLLKQAKLDSTAVFIRPDGGDKFKQTHDQSLNHETGTVKVTSPKTTAVKALRTIRSLGSKSKSLENEKNNQLLDFEFEHQQQPMSYHLPNEDSNRLGNGNRFSDAQLCTDSHGSETCTPTETSNKLNGNGNLEGNKNEDRDKTNMGNKTLQRLKSAKASVRQSFGKSKMRDEFNEFQPVPDPVSVSQPEVTDANNQELQNETAESKQRSIKAFNNPFDNIQKMKNDKGSNLSTHSNNNEDEDDLSKSRTSKGIMKLKQMRPIMPFKNKKGFNPFADPGEEESRERAQTVGSPNGLEEKHGDSIHGDDREEENGNDKRRRSLSLRSFKKKDNAESFDSTPFHID